MCVHQMVVRYLWPPTKREFFFVPVLLLKLFVLLLRTYFLYLKHTFVHEFSSSWLSFGFLLPFARIHTHTVGDKIFMYVSWKISTHITRLNMFFRTLLIDFKQQQAAHFYICDVYACYADDGGGNDYYMRRICYARWSIMTIWLH